MPVKHLWNLLFKASPARVLFILSSMGLVLAGMLFSRYWLNEPRCRELKYLLDQQSGKVISQTSDSQKVLLHSEERLFSYYQENNYTLIWISLEKAELLPHASQLIARIEKSYLEGLNPSDYHFEQLKTLSTLLGNNVPPSSVNKETLALLDIMLSDAYITYAGHQYAGRIHSTDFNTEWSKHIREINPMDSLRKIDEGIEMNAILDMFSCPYPSYKKLQDRLTKYCEGYPVENMDTDSCVKLMLLNMERWRWLQRKEPEVYLMANIADFSLSMVQHGNDTLSMRIIVGKPQQPTPLFEANLSYIVLNPWWEIPSGIAKKEMLPEIKMDTSYLTRNHIKVYDKRTRVEIPEGDFNWDTITEQNFNFRLRQLPGPWNALGEIKFIFPNKHDVYFHDTPHRELFSNEIRTFSHGCIRIEKPVDLAAILLAKDTAWIMERINSMKETALSVPASPKVFICYWTAWVDANGELCQVPDVYGYDKALEKLLNEPSDNNQNLVTECY